jgi:SpoVK/Ycf46/Vps4 family AAA+-type ATPase
VAAIVEKWGFDINGEPAGGVWDDSALLQGKNALEEVRKRLEEFGMQLPDEWEIADGGLSPSEIEEFAHEEGTPTPFAGPGWQELAKEAGFKRGCSPKTAARVLAKLGIKRVEDQSQAALVAGRGLSQVVGMAELKQQLSHEIIEAFRNPNLYRRYRVSVPNGILFYGPPGCGKTYIARCLAEELGFFFQYCRPSDVASPFIHDTVRKIHDLFTAAIEKAPSVLFIDEFDAFVPTRSQLGGFQHYKAEEVNEFLANLEGCAERNVLVIAATNEPERIDPAVRRAGRFDKLIYIPPPDAKARAALLAHYLEGRPLAEPIDGEGIAAILDGYSASDIKFLTDETARMALARTELISTETLLAAMGRVPPSITKEDEQRYASFRSRGV